ncbi:MAG TPA: sulfite exporter TauE/SafE family protein [Paucimonas sp.]|nr:sulfite exporter TauE/SafE family protein [Paucimonas sp.]
MTLTLVLGLMIGTILGLTGAGGGMLAVPALVMTMGWTMQQAAPVALVAVAVGAAVGAAEGFMRGLVRYRAALVMAGLGIPSALLGSAVAQDAPQTVLTAVFACLMLFVAFRLFRQSAQAENTLLVLGRINPDTGRFHWSPGTALLLAAIGSVAGFLTGLLGVGGGFVIVPLLRRFTDLCMHGIVATSLFVIALVGSGGIAAATLHGTAVPAGVTTAFAIATAAGIICGRVLIRRLPARQVQRGFSLALAAVAVGLLLKAFA